MKSVTISNFGPQPNSSENPPNSSSQSMAFGVPYYDAASGSPWPPGFTISPAGLQHDATGNNISSSRQMFDINSG
jgi:hypothetical protein